MNVTIVITHATLSHKFRGQKVVSCFKMRTKIYFQVSLYRLWLFHWVCYGFYLTCKTRFWQQQNPQRRRTTPHQVDYNTYNPLLMKLLRFLCTHADQKQSGAISMTKTEEKGSEIIFVIFLQGQKTDDILEVMHGFIPKQALGMHPLVRFRQGKPISMMFTFLNTS